MHLHLLVDLGLLTYSVFPMLSVLFPSESFHSKSLCNHTVNSGLVVYRINGACFTYFCINYIFSVQLAEENISSVTAVLHWQEQDIKEKLHPGMEISLNDLSYKAQTYLTSLIFTNSNIKSSN